MTRLTTLSGVRKAAALALAAGLLLTACGSDEPAATTSTTSTASSVATESSADPSAAPTTGSAGSESTTSETSSTSATDSAAGYPVTIEHAFGETTIESEPENVVTVSWQNQDIALALGVDPVAIPKVTYGGDDRNMFPWFSEALGGDPEPQLLDDSAGVPFEEISLLDPKPDLILAVYSGITQEDYDQLAAIAPTIAYAAGESYATDWKDATTVIGLALNKTDEAQQLIADTEDYVADLGAQYPQLAGKTFAYAYAPADQFYVYTPNDARVNLLTGLGLQVAPSVEALTTDAASFFVTVPFENLDSVQSDILVLLADTEEAGQTLLANPFVAALPQIQSGAYALIVGQQLVMAASAPSVLSIPWGFDQVVPLLAAAADKVA